MTSEVKKEDLILKERPPVLSTTDLRIEIDLQPDKNRYCFDIWRPGDKVTSKYVIKSITHSGLKEGFALVRIHWDDIGEIGVLKLEKKSSEIQEFKELVNPCKRIVSGYGYLTINHWSFPDSGLSGTLTIIMSIVIP